MTGNPPDNSNQAPKGAFTPEALATVKQVTRMRLQVVLSQELTANVGVCIHPLGRTLVTAYYGAESRLDLWDVPSHKHLQSLRLQSKGLGEMTGVMMIGPNGPTFGAPVPIRDLAIRPDGATLAVAAGNTVRLIGLADDGSEMSELLELDGEQQGVHAAVFSHSGELLVSASNDGQVLVWSVASNQIVARFRLENAKFRCAAFSSDDMLVACGDTKGNIGVWDVTTGQHLAWFQAHSGEVSTVEFAPSGHVMATGGFDGAIKMWDMASSRPLGQPMLHGDSVYDVVFSSDGALLLSSSFDHNVGVWRTDSQMLVDAYVDVEAVLALDISRDNRTVALVTSSSIKLVSHDRALMASASPGLPAPATQEKPAPAAGGDGLVVGDLDDDYLKARRNTGLAPPVAPSLPPLSQPGVSFKSEDSGPLIPARTPQPFRVDHLPEAIGVPSRKPSAAPAKKTGGGGGRAILAILLAAIVSGVVGFAAFTFVPKATDSDEFKTQKASIEARYKDKIDQENKAHTRKTEEIQRKLDSLANSPLKKEKQATTTRLEREMGRENDRHDLEMSGLKQAQGREVAATERDLAIDPAWIAAPAAAGTFVVMLGLFWVMISRKR